MSAPLYALRSTYYVNFRTLQVMDDLLIISGSNRKGNFTSLVAKYYLSCLQAQAASSSILLLEELPRDIAFTDAIGEKNPAFEPFQAQVTKASGFVFVAPEYNGSMPGILKLFIDSLEFPISLRGKKAALVGVSAGRFGNLRGLDHLDAVLNYCGVRTLPYRVHIADVQAEFSPDHGSVSQDTESQIKTQIRLFGEM